MFPEKLSEELFINTLSYVKLNQTTHILMSLNPTGNPYLLVTYLLKIYLALDKFMYYI